MNTITVICILFLMGGIAGALVLIHGELQRARELLERVPHAIMEAGPALLAGAVALRREAPPPRALLRRAGPDMGLLRTEGMLHCHGHAVIEPGTVGRVRVTPRRANYCIPKGVTILVHAQGWPSIEQRAEIFQVYINQNPQIQHHWMEGFDTDDDGEMIDPDAPRWGCKHCEFSMPYDDEDPEEYFQALREELIRQSTALREVAP